MNSCGDEAVVRNVAFCVKVLFGVWSLAALCFFFLRLTEPIRVTGVTEVRG